MANDGVSPMTDQKVAKRPRNPDGSFAKGGPPPPPNAHRAKGVMNKISADIKQGVVDGLARHGSDGEGEGGFPGFVFYLAKKHPKQAANSSSVCYRQRLSSPATTALAVSSAP